MKSRTTERWQQGWSTLLPFALLCLLFCFIPEAGAELRQGMSREEVIEAWGEPRGHMRRGGVEIIHFDRGREVELRDGRVVHVVGGTMLSPQTAAPATPDPTPPATQEELDAILEKDFKKPPEPGLSFAEKFTGPVLIGILVLSAALCLLMFVSAWRIFTKAGEPGWAIFVPIYNLVVLIRMAQKPGWWLLLMFIPPVNLVSGYLVTAAIAREFGKETGFTLGLIFFPFIFYPILAFGDAEYGES